MFHLSDGDFYGVHDCHYSFGKGTFNLSDILSLKGISFLGINKQVDFIPCPKK